MTKSRVLSHTASFIGILVIIFILTACDFSFSKSSQAQIPELGDQSLVDVPGGVMVVGDGGGNLHPVLLYNYQIQSRLVTAKEYLDYAAGQGGTSPSDQDVPEEGIKTDFPELPAGEEALFPAGVTWYQAQAYCESMGGRLPTEAELVKLTQTDPSCPDADYAVTPLGGYGEWVYDWDDPDYYGESLLTNPFGPSYGDLKVVLGLDLGLLSDVMDKIILKEKWDIVNFKSRENYYKIDLDKNGLKIESSDAELKSWSSVDESELIPRLGMLPGDSSPLVGFRCVTQGAVLAHAPFCRTNLEANCSPAGESLNILPQFSLLGVDSPQLEITAASCPDGGRVRITIQHNLPATESLDVKGLGGSCECQEYPEYPGKLFCSCASPGGGNYLNVDICQDGEATPISLEEFCPPGYSYNTGTGTCLQDLADLPPGYDLDSIPSGEGLGCPASSDIPGRGGGGPGKVDLQDLGLVEPASEDRPEGEDWTLASRGDASGMCPLGYTYNEGTGCCGSLSEENYNCAEGQYFDAGLKRCLPVSQDGCGPCQEYDAGSGCVNRRLASQGCNLDAPEVEKDEHGRIPSGDTGGCPAGSRLDSNLGICTESWDGCPIGYYLASDGSDCLPIMGPASGCALGYSFQPILGCCLPGPGLAGNACPEGGEYEDGSCGEEGGCPLGYRYDSETDSCRIVPAASISCPAGTFYDAYSGFCLQLGGEAQECGYLALNLTEGEIQDASVVTGAPLADAVGGEIGSLLNGACLVCSADKLVDGGQGFCRRPAKDGLDEDHFTIDFEQNRIASISRTSPDVLDPAAANAPADGGICPNYSIFSEGACYSQTCLRLEIGVPTCTTESEGTKSHCAGKVFTKCINDPLCHWNGVCVDN